MCIERAPVRPVRDRRQRQGGMTLIELIMFIVIVSVGVVGILSVLNITAKSSADPMIRKQMLAIAEALLEEVEMMPFTYCDPDDQNVATAASTAGCTSGYVEALGPETIASVKETRSSTPSFDNVNDYYVSTGFALPGPITDITGGNPAPAGYSATIAIVPEALNGIASTSAPLTMEVLRIAVTVTHGGDSLMLEGYRTRHSPNFTP